MKPAPIQMLKVAEEEAEMMIVMKKVCQEVKESNVLNNKSQKKYGEYHSLNIFI